MNKLFQYITSIILLLFFSVGVSAQETGKAGKNDVYVGDPVLSREGRTLIIEYDLDMGQNVTACEVELLISLNGGTSFAPISTKNKMQGDIGRMTTSGQKKITYDIDTIKEQLAGKKIAFKVQVKNKKKLQDNKGKFFIMGTASTPGMYGLKTGYVGKFGGYVSYKDAFSGGIYRSFSGTAGGVMRATSWLYPYVGVGYGQVNYEIAVFDIVPFEIGAMFKFGPVSLSAAVVPSLSLSEGGPFCLFEFGVGFCF